MSTAALPKTTEFISVQRGEWIEGEYLELGQTSDRVELIDGSLLVSPSALPHHQEICLALGAVMRPLARAVGLRVFPELNLRLKEGRIVIPDLAIGDEVDRQRLVVDAERIRLVCEVTSPSNAANDRILKMALYAEAGIPWYLVVEPKPPVTLQLFRLHGDRYAYEAEGWAGTPLRLTDPITLDLDPAKLDL